MEPRRRSNSTSNVFRLREEFRAIPREDNPILTLAARSQAAEQRNSEYMESLPKLTERDIATLQLTDAACPICIVPFSAILAEEEIAGAMDSPAYAVEDLGVTKLDQSCNHVFCRKDIRNWLMSGHNSCPTCRRPLVESSPDVAEAPARLDELLQATQASMQNIESLQQDMSTRITSLGELSAIFRNAGLLPTDHGRDAQSEPDVDHNRGDFSGMYS